jgi:hypothetical protein
MATATNISACTRCDGSGVRNTPRAHLGVPGLCFDCHGDGTRQTQLITQAGRKEARRLERLRAIKCGPIEQRIWATRNANHVANDLHYQRLAVLQALGRFTTQEYADRLGITKTAAWIELCCNRRVYVNWSRDFEALGWTISE